MYGYSVAYNFTHLHNLHIGSMQSKVLFVSNTKVGVEITDSPYVVASMRVMTRIGDRVMPIVEAEASTSGNQGFVRAVHSVGQPMPLTGKKAD